MDNFIWNGLGTFVILLSLPGTIEILLLTIFSLPTARRVNPIGAKRMKIMVIIPAHNEETHVVRAIKSLLKCEREGHELTVTVVADNCRDRTAELALLSGARVFIRTDLNNRGKGQALNFAFRMFGKEDFDAFIILDADTVVEQNFIIEFIRYFQAGADAAQCRYLVKNPDASPRARLMNLALLGMHVVRPRGRSRLGISCGIFGNGFGMTKQTLEETPYSADSIVEDMEYHSLLLKAGKKVVFVDETTVKADFPAKGPGVSTQRERWEGGRLRMIRDKAPVFLKEVLKGNRRFVEPLLEILTLPLAYHVVLIMLALAVPVSFVRTYALTALGVIFCHVLTAVLIAGEKSDLFALVTVPYYIFWKIVTLGGIVKTARKNADWVRTEREIKLKIKN